MKILFLTKIWLNDQHLGSAMQILYVEKLQSLGYEQHTYAIIGKKCMSIKKCFQHIFINNDHWVLIKIYMSTPNLHCIIYNSHMPMTKKLPSDTIQLLLQTYKCEQVVIHICKCNATNKQLITWCFHNSICNIHWVWILSRKISICFDTNANTFMKTRKQ
jgi:hypothetical protein